VKRVPPLSLARALSQLLAQIAADQRFRFSLEKRSLSCLEAAFSCPKEPPPRRADCVWSASGLPELWITSERKLVGAARPACSRAYVIQSGRKRASASIPNLAGRAAMFWSASGLPELWIAPEQELVRAARPACSRAYVIQSGRKRASASTPNLGGGAAVFWSASGLAELWIAPERELVGAAVGPAEAYSPSLFLPASYG